TTAPTRPATSQLAFHFIEPGHLDRLEDLLVGPGGIVDEAVELGHPLVQVGEADVQHVLVGMLLDQREGDVLRIGPAQRLGDGHQASFCDCFSASALWRSSGCSSNHALRLSGVISTTTSSSATRA